MAFKRSAVRSRLSPPKTRKSEEKALKSSDFKAFSFPKVEKSQYLQKAPVRLVFDGNFENQEVRYDEENQDELHRHIGRNLCRFHPFPQGKGASIQRLLIFRKQLVVYSK